MRLLVDEDTQSLRLVARLRAAGHDVLTAREAGLAATPDHVLLRRAAGEGRAILTRNVSDFRALHGVGERHAGILGIFFDADPRKDLSDAHIVLALANLEAAGVPLAGEVYALNAWSW